jgi:hypothetical protein
MGVLDSTPCSGVKIDISGLEEENASAIRIKVICPK